MKKIFSSIIVLSVIFSACSHQEDTALINSVLLKDVTLIDGNGGLPQEHVDLLIQADTIAQIGKNLDTAPLKVINLAGKTIMPSLISSHVHVGTLRGTKTELIKAVSSWWLQALKITDRTIIELNIFFMVKDE